MRNVLAGLVAVSASLTLFAFAASAGARSLSFAGGVNLRIDGWGAVTPGSGFDLHSAVPCTNTSCSEEALFAHRPHVVLTARPYKGWNFLRWRGPCKTKTSTRCEIDLGQVHANASGQRVALVRAIFIPVAPGLTPANPIPIETAANIGPLLTIRVNSATANVQLSPAAAPGSEYYDADLTVTYKGSGSVTAGGLLYRVMGSAKTPYGLTANGCPAPGPQPALDLTDSIYSGQSTSGYVCWTISASDESSLELYFGTGTFNYPGTTWFALH